MPTTTTRPRIHKMALPLLLGIIAIGLRLIELGQESFWTDEVHSLHAIRSGVFEHISRIECSPPLFFYLSYVWSELFSCSHVALRSLSAVLGGLAVPALYLCGRRWGLRPLGCVVISLWLMLHPTAYFQSQQNRYYALLLLLGIVWLATIPAILKNNAERKHAWAFFALAGFACFLTHYYFMFYMAASISFTVIWWLSTRKEKPWRFGPLQAHLALLFLMATLTPLLAFQLKNGPMNYLPVPKVPELWNTYFGLYWFGQTGQPFLWQSVLGLVLTTLALGGLLWPWLQHRSMKNPGGAGEGMGANGLIASYFLTISIGANLIPFLISISGKPVYYPERYSTLFLPSFMLLVGLGIDRFPIRINRLIYCTMSLLFLVWGGYSLQVMWHTKQMFDWQGAIQTINTQWKTGDAVVFFPGWLSGNYRDNGGVPPKSISAKEIESISSVNRIWLFAWENAPEQNELAPLKQLREDSGNRILMDNAGITMSLIEAGESHY